MGDLDEWHRIGARGKAESVVVLAGRLPVDRVLEVGAGTGTVLEELSRRGFGSRYWAVEPSETLNAELLAKRIPGLQDAYSDVLDKAPLDEGPFDLAILSHVLEHVLDPAVLLGQALAHARKVVVEVPLERTFLGELRARARESITGTPRAANASGHVNFWAPRQVETIIEAAGGSIVGRRLYFPREAYAYIANETGGWLGMARKVMLRFPERLVARYYHGYLALLVDHRQKPSDWQHDAYYPPQTAAVSREAEGRVAGRRA